MFYVVKKHVSLYSKTFVKLPLSKRPQIGFQDQLSLNVGRKYCRMLPLEHSAILSTFIKLPLVIKIFVLSILRGPFRQVLLYVTTEVQISLGIMIRAFIVIYCVNIIVQYIYHMILHLGVI